jgi:hypothetical protein
MVGVVQADGDEVADLSHAGAETLTRRDDREGAGIGLFQAGETIRRKGRSGDIGKDARYVADLASGIDEPRLLASCFPISHQLHQALLSLRHGHNWRVRACKQCTF